MPVHDTGKTMMIEILKMMEAEVENAKTKVSGEGVKVDLEVGPQKKPLSKAEAMFSRAFKKVKGDKSKIEHSRRTCKPLIFRKRSPVGNRTLAAEHTIEGEGHAQEEWHVFPEVLKQVGIDFDETLFDTLVKVEIFSADTSRNPGN